MTFPHLSKKFNNKHFLSLAGNGTMSALSMITYAMLYRLLPEADMGNWVFFQFMYALLDSLRTGFLQTPLVKFYSGASVQTQTSIAGSTWYIAMMITGVFCLLNLPLLLAIPYIEDSGIKLFFTWYGLTLLCTLPLNIAFWILQAQERFDQILVLRLVNQGSFIISLILLIVNGRTALLSVVYFYIVCALVTSAVALILGWSRQDAFKHRTANDSRILFNFGKYSVGTYICSSLLRSSDSIIIKFMIGPAALAVYNLAQRVGEVIELLIRSLLGTAMPSMAAAYNKDNKPEVVYIMKKYASALTLILIPVIILMVIFADILILILGGPKYQHTEAANLLRIFMLLALTFPIDRFFGVTLDIIHKPQLNMLKVILTLLINVITDVIALKVLGSIYGAAVASFVTLIFSILFGHYTLNKYLPFNLKGFFKLGYDELRLMLLKK